MSEYHSAEAYASRRRKLRRKQRIDDGIDSFFMLFGLACRLFCLAAFVYYGIKGFNVSSLHNIQMTLFFGIFCVADARRGRGEQ